MITATMLTPSGVRRRDFGAVPGEARHSKGAWKATASQGPRCCLTYELPFNEVVLDFYDPLQDHLAGLCLA